MTGKTFVVADIHGRLDLLEKALAAIENRAASGQVIFTGDFIDRGPESRAVVARLMAGPPEEWVWRFVRGNHEDMLLTCMGGDNLGWWVANGGGATIASYDGEIDQGHVDWMGALPRLLWDEHRVYVHAGVEECYDLHEQPEAVTQWFRYPARADVGYRGRHVVHGHTPMQDGPELYLSRTNLDTGGFFTGRMVVGVFDDDKPGGPVDLIEVSA